MGEHIKNLDVIKLKGQTIRIELNKNDVEDLEYDIHLEAPYFRYNMSDHEFMKFAASVVEAKRKLEHKLKGL
ncbi:MAG: hypothetical protein HFI31_07425 [Lachnospiraceae bacterium]|jgi:hypothetical protein|nr:hypothetical protein [Lachnospiraceae bacterium]MCI9134000.1 hypothetical protein [Lachnospiraceae bacterium]